VLWSTFPEAFMGAARERGLGGLVLFEGVEAFQEQQPRSLLSLVEFASATGVFPENVVDVFEGF
jgi:hypothetical protein